jgi:MFS family permease
MRADRNIRLLEAHAALVNMLFVVPVIMPLYRDRMGLSFRDFLLGEAAFAAVVLALDVPTGWLSDLWKRKHVLALGTLVTMSGYAVMLAAHGLALAVTAQALIGVGISLLNGTNSALLYESLMAEGREAEYRRREGRRAGMGLYSVAAASVLGGLLYARGHALPIMLTLPMHALAVLAACLMDEPERHRKRPEKHPVADIIATTRYALGHPEVGLIIIFAAVMFCSTKLIMWSQQPYYMLLGLHEEFYGVLMAVGFVLGGFSSHMSHRLDGRVNSFQALGLVWGLAVGACLGAAWRPGWHGVALLMIGGTCLYGIAAPRVSEAINRHVGSERRATILSTQSLMVSLLFIPLSMLVGRVSERFGVQAVLIGLAGWLSVAGLCLILYALRRGAKQKTTQPIEAAELAVSHRQCK